LAQKKENAKKEAPKKPISSEWQPPAAASYEKLGQFYLGRPYDLGLKQPQPGILLYDSKDLVTHAVCVGMTGSGKTGLCVALLEEAALDGVPAIVIDPKGDLGNLLLTFPELRPEDFRPWINEDDARQRGLSAEEYAKQQAQAWRQGLLSWGEDGDRIRRLKAAAEFTIYTPGSNAGVPLSILRSFEAPEPALRQDPELLQERVGNLATSLLGLVGIQADPIKSREHILLSTLFSNAWSAGQDLDLESLIQQVQTPPISRVGVLDLESFYPAKERFNLAMALNRLLAAPGFQTWLEGEPLDIGRMLYTQAGKPRVSICSIAHLSDAERMFFVSLLLNQVLGWMRGQSGTTSLRALLYMDEIFGFFPPVAAPPSKRPLLSLLKQARAFGLGIVLATQNPVDLDYKGLSNTGTWFLGRLQTERDKARVLDGLEGAAASASANFDRRKIEQTLAGLSNRVFLLNNVHEDAPVIFESRWAMSYLRGPLTRDQIKILVDGRTSERAAVAPQAAAAAAPTLSSVPSAQRPALPPDVPQRFIPARGGPANATLVYEAMALGMADIRFRDAKLAVDESTPMAYVAPIGPGGPDWTAAKAIELKPAELESAPLQGAAFGNLSEAATRAKNYSSWSDDFRNWLFRNEKLDLRKSPTSGATSRPGESEAEFRSRSALAGRERRDAELERLRAKYAPKIHRLEERIRNAQQVVEREAGQVRSQGLQTAISVGATILASFLGRKRLSYTSMGRATTAARGAGRVIEQQQDVGRAKADVAAAQRDLDALNTEFQEATATLGDAPSDELQVVTVRPKMADISVSLLTLAWAPYWVDANGARSAAWE
jgi:uncharacterized protein DUF87